MKRRKTYLLAAICLVLVVALAAGCSFAGSAGSTAPEETQPSTQPTEGLPVSTAPTETTEATGAYDSWRPAGAQDIAEVWQRLGLDELLPIPPVEWGRQKAGVPLHSVAVEVRYESVAVLNQYVKQLQEAGFNLHQGGSFVASNAQGYTVALTGETMWDYACIWLYWPEAEFKNDWKDHLSKTSAPGSDIPEPPATNWLQENNRFYLEGMDYKNVYEYIQTLKSYGFDQVEILEDDGSSVMFQALGVFTEAKITCGVWIEFDLASDSMPEGYTCSLLFFRRYS